MKSSLRGKMNSSGPMETITRQRASRYVQKWLERNRERVEADQSGRGEIERAGDSKDEQGRMKWRRGKGEKGVAVYVIRREKAELRARYHLSSGKWYSNGRVVFHTGGFYNARYYSTLLSLSRLSSSLSHRCTSPPNISPTLAGCGLHSAAFAGCFSRVYSAILACFSLYFACSSLVLNYRFRWSLR